MIITAFQLREVVAAAALEFHRLDNAAMELSFKADGSPLTAVDLGLDRFLRRRLADLAPEASWLSEESAEQVSAGAWTWVIDPLDGTKEYARRIPECAISIGLVEGERIRAGVVMNPLSGHGAAAGTDGSWLQWPPVEPLPHPVRPDDLTNAVASVSRSEIDDGSAQPYLDLVGQCRPVGSVANKLLRTACAVDDLTFSVQPKSIWDICGGIALLEARDMVFCRLDGRPTVFNRTQTRIPDGFVAGPPAMAAAMMRELRARLPALHKHA